MGRIKQLLLSCIVFLSLEGNHPAIIKQEFIFINPPFNSCYCPTLTEFGSGTLLCAFYAGTEEGAPDVAIWLSTFDKTDWSVPRKIAELEGVPCWNPVLFTLGKEVLLFYKGGKNPREWSGFLKRSMNGGHTWSHAELLPAGVIGPVKNKPLLLEDGTLLCGSSIESWMRWGCWMDMTTDCISWKKSAPINVSDHLFGIIQPALFLGKNGAIKMLARSNQIGFICTAESYDGGNTWSPATPLSLPNPNASIDAINLVDGRVFLVYNHSKTHRYPLNIAISKDDGLSWETKMTLEDKPGEYSHPSVIQTKDGLVHIVYTWHRLKIKHVVINPHLL